MRTLVAWTTLALALAAPTAAQDLDQARTAVRSGQYDEALRLATAAGSSAPALAVRARVLMDTGRYDEVIGLLGGRSGPAPSPARERRTRFHLRR